MLRLPHDPGFGLPNVRDMVRHVSTSERRELLARRHRLTPSSRTNEVATIAADLVALHSSDPATVFLSALVRMIEPAIEPIESALYEDKALLRYHGVRRTIWVSSPEMVVAMNASSTRKIAKTERSRLLSYFAATSGIANPGLELANIESAIFELLAEVGPLTTREVGTRRPELARKITIGSGVHTAEAGAHGRVLNLSGFEGRLFRGRPSGSWVGSEYTWHLAENWTPTDLSALDERAGAAGVIRALLERFGPCTETDLRWWTGWTARLTRGAVADVGAVEVSLDDGANGWVLPNDPMLIETTPLKSEPWVAVLPGLDPTTMGWKERGWYLDEAVKARVFDRNGNAGPTIWRDGEVVGGWAQRPNGDLAVELVHALTTAERTLLDAELDRVRSAIGDVRFRVRFPSPNQKDLLRER